MMLKTKRIETKKLFLSSVLGLPVTECCYCFRKWYERETPLAFEFYLKHGKVESLTFANPEDRVFKEHCLKLLMVAIDTSLRTSGVFKIYRHNSNLYMAGNILQEICCHENMSFVYPMASLSTNERRCLFPLPACYQLHITNKDRVEWHGKAPIKSIAQRILSRLKHLNLEDDILSIEDDVTFSADKTGNTYTIRERHHFRVCCAIQRVERYRLVL